MISPLIYYSLLATWLFLAAIVFCVLWFISAPYGRFARAGWGPGLPSRLSWLLMESPAVLVFDGLFWSSSQQTPVAWCFCLIWNGHYVYRSFLYPLLLRSAHRVPLTIAASGWCFNVGNAFLQAYFLFHLAPPSPAAWLHDVRFWIGLALFLSGLVMHVHSDAILRGLRRTDGSGYQIPHGGLFRWVSCPNYLGEIIEWTGWAILTWSWPGGAFAVWTAANLIPRAVQIHTWYRATFAEYPPQRSAILPWWL